MITLGILVILSALMTNFGIFMVHRNVSYENIYGAIIFIGALLTVIFSIIGVVMILLTL